MKKQNDFYYIIMTSRKKYLKYLKYSSRTYNIMNAYRFKSIVDAIKNKHLAGSTSKIVRMPTNIIIDLPEK